MKKKLLLVVGITLCFLIVFNLNTNIVSADELSETIESQVGNLDLKELENYFNSMVETNENDFFDCFNSLLKGEYNFNYESISKYFVNVFFSGIVNFLPTFIDIATIFY